MLAKHFLCGLIACFFSFSVYAKDNAELIFEQSSPMVFQVKIIDKASGNKSTIGSGFQVSSSGVIATNYHVVSDYVLEQDKYTIEVLDHEDASFKASLINFDIVHDLALLQVEGLASRAFTLNRKKISQGTRIYSMGNPNDLGMTIVEGTYNGVVEASRYQKYLFSGSLNPGMSGGPVFNHAGQVIGINVSKSGEQIGFLVPVKHLYELINLGFEPLQADEYKKHARDYLIKDQDDYYSMLINLDWLMKDFQSYMLPDKIHDSLKCWGDTSDNEDSLYEATYRNCKTEDEIYINSSFYTGAFRFSYKNISSEELNTNQFYHLLEQNYSMSSFSNGYTEDDTTNFSCITDFIELSSDLDSNKQPWKITTCIREYVEYKGLYDAGLIAMNAHSDNGKHEALVIKLNATGIAQQNITRLHDKFLSLVKWKQ